MAGPMTVKIRLVLIVLFGISLLGTGDNLTGVSQASETIAQDAGVAVPLPTPVTNSSKSPDNVSQHSSSSPSKSNYVQFAVGTMNVKAMLVDGPITWVGTTGGLYRYDVHNNKHIHYHNRNGLLSNGIFSISKFENELWVGTYGGGLSILNIETDRWRNYNIPQGMGDAFVYDVLKTRSGDIWIATWSGANRVVNGDMDSVESWELYTVENTGGGLPNDWVYGLAEGAAGEIWLATEGGLARFENGKWRNWDHADGLGAPYEKVSRNKQFENDPGQYSAHHARQKKEQGLEDVAVAFNPNYIISLVVDEGGTVWAGTWGAGLSRFDGKDWITYTESDGLPANHIFSLSSDGGIWVGTSRGLSRFDGAGFTTYGMNNGLYSERVFSIEIGDDGGMWIGGFGGITWFPRGIELGAGEK